MPKKQKSFIITQWNTERTKEDYKELMEKHNIRFIAYGEEVTPTTKKLHHQMFVYFWNDISVSKNNLNKIAKFWGETHARVAPMLGNFRQNEFYCSKEHKYHKLGDEPQQGARGDIVENKNAIMEGRLKPDEIMLLDPSHYHMYSRTYNEIYSYYMSQQFRTEMTQGIWYYGATDVGKSHQAFVTHQLYDPKKCYNKDLNVKWWDNYKQQDICILNEFRGQLKFSELLSLVDKWPKDVPIRNRPSIPFTSKTVIITSSKHPKNVYENALDDEESFAQFERRFKIIELFKNGEEVSKG